MFLTTVEFPKGDRTYEMFETQEDAQRFIQELVDLKRTQVEVYEV